VSNNITQDKKKRRDRGDGCCYLRGNVYWLRYTNLDGNVIQESSGFKDEAKAKAMLRSKAGQITDGKLVIPKAHTLTVAEIVEQSLNEAESLGRVYQADYASSPLVEALTKVIPAKTGT